MGCLPSISSSLRALAVNLKFIAFAPRSFVHGLLHCIVESIVEFPHASNLISETRFSLSELCVNLFFGPWLLRPVFCMSIQVVTESIHRCQKHSARGVFCAAAAGSG